MKAANVYPSVTDSSDRRRIQYHPLSETLSGLTVCCRNGMMIGLYTHSSEVSSYSTFIDSVQSRFCPQDLLWIFFPIKMGERILNVWVRRFKNLEGVASRPSIMVNSPPSRHILLKLRYIDCNNPFESLRIRSICRCQLRQRLLLSLSCRRHGWFGLWTFSQCSRD
jgi:hypothetical protein